MDFAKGLKTYTGIVLLVFATVAQSFGWDWYADISGQVETAATHFVALAGAVLAVYGKFMASRREKTLKAELEAKA